MRYSAATMRRHLQAQAAGSATVSAYCAAHDLKVATFYYWRKKLAASEQESAEQEGFTRITPTAEPGPRTLRLPSGLCLELSGLSTAQLADLVIAIERRYA
jgi:transposase-like protein